MKLGIAVVYALGVSLAWGPRAGAEEPSGGYTIEINGESGLIVPTGEAEVCEDGVCVSTDVTTSVSGLVSGSGAVAIESDATDIDLQLVGRVSGSTAKPKLVLAFLAEGDADGVDLQGKGKLKCALGSAPGLLECTGKAKICAFELGQKLGCEKLPFATQVAFLRQPFALDLDLDTILAAHGHRRRSRPDRRHHDRVLRREGEVQVERRYLDPGAQGRGQEPEDQGRAEEGRAGGGRADRGHRRLQADGPEGRGRAAEHRAGVRDPRTDQSPSR